jgi:MOSC domain-containing protein YiiM
MLIIKSLNIGLPKKESFFGKEYLTGICKLPVPGPLRLTKLGFEGDGVGDRKNHGGADKALCVYSLDHYPYWSRELGITLPDAAFGENLSVEGLREEDVCIGDIYRIGTAVVQVTQPRQPCGTLAARYGRPDFVKVVSDSGRTGFYFKVLTEGFVKAGEPLILTEPDLRAVTITFANHIWYQDRRNREGIEKVLSVPALSGSWRKSFLELREKA